jgi:predicted nucleic acid-binding protein
LIFLDTNIWMNLLVITISDKDYENIQIQKASKFLETNKDTIITCREQQIELINSILKYKRKECNRKLKESGQKGIGSVKEFRHYEEFNQAVDLCKMIYNDMLNFAQIDNNFSYDIDCIIEHLSEADINDYMYLKYCLDNNIKLYTFDKELANNDKNNIVILL